MEYLSICLCHLWFLSFSSVQFNSVAQSCPTVCDPMNCSTPGHPVHHQILEFTQTHIRQVSDAIQPSHPLSSPSSPAPNPSQYQSLFKWVNSLHEVAKVLEFQLQHQSFIWTPRTDLLQNGLVGSPCSSRDSQESSPTPQCKSINSSVLSFLYGPVLASIHDYLKPIALTRWNFVSKRMSLLFNMLSRFVIRSSLVIYFIHSSVCMSIPISQSILAPFPALVSMHLFFTLVSPFLFCK